MERPLSVVLSSGGLDSAVTAAIAASVGDIALLHANYGQRTEARELKAFTGIADHYGVLPDKRLVVDMTFLRDIGGSALTDTSIEVPEGDLAREGVPVTYVPFRNAHLLSAGVSWLEALVAEASGPEAIGASSVYIGAVEEDSSGYPDCRSAFLRAFEGAVNLGIRPGRLMRIMAPLVRLTKKEIVEIGVKLDAPFELTWSCYTDSEVACGSCDSCLLRLRGFREAGVEDPITYKGVGV